MTMTWQWLMAFSGISTDRQRRNRKSRRRKPRQFQLEILEPRVALAADVRPIDGVGNNLQHPTWGSDGTDFLRLAPAQYADGISTPAGTDRPSARAISNVVASHPDTELTNNRDLSAFIYAWGQFLDHDIDLTLSATPAQAFNIAVPKGDPWFDPQGTGTQTIPLSRSNYDPTTGLRVGNPRQQINAITAFIDGSQVYGSDSATAAALRTFSGGKLKTSDGNLLPVAGGGPFFQAGDIRVNENPALQAMQTLFLREHNRLAEQISRGNPNMSDEDVYQQARRIVVAELQVITYREFLPALLGTNLRPYQGYNARVNPGIANEFATAAFRLGHSMLGEDIGFLDNDGNDIRDEVALRDAFFNTDLIKETGIDPILKYLASDRAEEIDTRVIDDVRNFLFGPPGTGGFDLASLNIQRGRDHGLADYNTVRAAYGLPRVRSFGEITSDPALQQQLRSLYGTVDKIDVWVGGLAENHVPGGSVGPLFARIIADQFTRLRDGDRFWYQRDLPRDLLRQVESTTLADVIRRNTVVSNLQANVFFFQASISGQVFGDLNQDGMQQRSEAGLANIAVQLLDQAGNVVATTRTTSDGRYTFEHLDLGQYKVRVVAPARTLATTAPTNVTLTRGMEVRSVNLGLFRLGLSRNGGPQLATLPQASPRNGMRG